MKKEPECLYVLYSLRSNCDIQSVSWAILFPFAGVSEKKGKSIASLSLGSQSDEIQEFESFAVFPPTLTGSLAASGHLIDGLHRWVSSRYKGRVNVRYERRHRKERNGDNGEVVDDDYDNSSGDDDDDDNDDDDDDDDDDGDDDDDDDDDDDNDDDDDDEYFHQISRADSTAEAPGGSFTLTRRCNSETHRNQ
ncbi:hypothetical protein PoB_006274300 [Plakobranchus ocellatus]|uniref:Uncharacterized protein n=1 Tax=Plakobranchus ocellatus TaxID=259542 RepID=A0AAV4CWJ1_9GAST|nr:hypothetical protein PoB_006274300 [Plakobranchus ocellatus]